jgi:hypothetical protein
VAQVGNTVDSSRYGVYPQGTYPIGDYWYEVIEYVPGAAPYSYDACGNVNLCVVTPGYYRSAVSCYNHGLFGPCFGKWSNCYDGCPGCFADLGCGCTITCTPYISLWKTKYKIWTYLNQVDGWYDNGDIIIDGYHMS